MDTDLIQVSVISDKENGEMCDALSTILLMLGKEKGLEFINNYEGYEAIFLDLNGDVACSNSKTEFKSWKNE